MPALPACPDATAASRYAQALAEAVRRAHPRRGSPSTGSFQARCGCPEPVSDRQRGSRRAEALGVAETGLAKPPGGFGTQSSGNTQPTGASAPRGHPRRVKGPRPPRPPPVREQGRGPGPTRPPHLAVGPGERLPWAGQRGQGKGLERGAVGGPRRVPGLHPHRLRGRIGGSRGPVSPRGPGRRGEQRAGAGASDFSL